MVSGQEIDITIDEEFRAGQGTPKTKEEIYSAMIVLGFLSYNDGYLKIPNKELMIEFEKALRDKSFGYVSCRICSTVFVSLFTVAFNIVLEFSIISDT